MDISTIGTVVGIVAICYVIYKWHKEGTASGQGTETDRTLHNAGLSGRRCDQCSCGRNGKRISGNGSKSVI